MLKELLKRFNEQQMGPTTFKLPQGGTIDLSKKTQRIALTDWVLALFGNNEKRAKDNTMQVVPRALGKGAPWPYLIRALWNKADRRSTFVTNNASYQEVKSEFVALFGKSRLSLLNELTKVCTDTQLVVAGTDLDLTQDDDRIALLSWLIKHPYATFVSLSPQNFHDFSRRKNLALVIRQVNRVILSESSVSISSLNKSETLKIIKQCINSSIVGSEYQEVLKLLYRFYTHCDHIYPLTFYNPYKNCESYLYNEHDRGDLLLYLKTIGGLEKTPECLKCDWLSAALTLGIVTHPLNWLISVYSRKFDTTEDWKDWDWYDMPKMATRYGLIPVKNLTFYKKAKV